MGKKQHNIPAEVKAEILKRVKDGGTPVAEIAEEHGIMPATIYGWLGASAKVAPTWSEFAKLKRERDEYGLFCISPRKGIFQG